MSELILFCDTDGCIANANLVREYEKFLTNGNGILKLTDLIENTNGMLLTAIANCAKQYSGITLTITSNRQSYKLDRTNGIRNNTPANFAMILAFATLLQEKTSKPVSINMYVSADDEIPKGIHSQCAEKAGTHFEAVLDLFNKNPQEIIFPPLSLQSSNTQTTPRKSLKQMAQKKTVAPLEREVELNQDSKLALFQRHLKQLENWIQNNSKIICIEDSLEYIENFFIASANRNNEAIYFNGESLEIKQTLESNDVITNSKEELQQKPTHICDLQVLKNRYPGLFTSLNLLECDNVRAPSQHPVQLVAQTEPQGSFQMTPFFKQSPAFLSEDPKQEENLRGGLALD